jgi:nitroreductase
MDVSEAMAKRISTRAFLPKPVETEKLLELLEMASRAPSGGNLQPWRVFVVNGEAMEKFRTIMEARLSGVAHPRGDQPQYQVYPEKLKEPFRTQRFDVGEDMYGLLGIERENRTARLEWFAQNYRFFGAPAAIFCFVDRVMGPPQWSDLGMFLQSFMLLAEEAGLQTCAQECWSRYPDTVADFCKAPPEWMLFCGMAIGYGDRDHRVNRLRSKRAPLNEWASIL